MKKLFAIVLCGIMLFSLAACSGGDSESSADDDRTMVLMVAAKNSVAKFLDDVDYSNDVKEWVMVDSDGLTSVSTKVTVGDDAEKKLVNVVLTLKEDGRSYVTHFVEVGGEVYFDDGSIE